MGMVQLGPYSIQIIDVRSLLALGKNDSRTQSRLSANSSRALENRKREIAQEEADDHPPFLVVLQDAQKHFWGIPLHRPPDLMDVPNYALKPVPAHQRSTSSLKWISHLVSYDLNSDRHSLLLLDLSLILDPQGASTSAVEAAGFVGIDPPMEAASFT
ncbi:MAG: hypothetical protein AAFO84_11840 [Cyanobacteria bacterium J06598_1]